MGWRATLGVHFPLYTWPRELSKSPLSSRTPLPELVQGPWKGRGGGKSRPAGGTFTGLEGQRKRLQFSGPLSPKQPPEAPGLVLHISRALSTCGGPVDITEAPSGVRRSG